MGQDLARVLLVVPRHLLAEERAKVEPSDFQSLSLRTQQEHGELPIRRDERDARKPNEIKRRCLDYISQLFLTTQEEEKKLNSSQVTIGKT